MIDAQASFPTPLQCLFIPKRYKVLWGGRGAGRSWGVARALLIKGTEQPLRILCARELQKSIEESVHKVLTDQIDMLGLREFYDVQKIHIFGKNGTIFSFEGIKNNVNKIRSYEGIDICWVEEANKVSRNSWTILTPTIRKKGSEIWITFNPELEEDYTYDRFVKKADPENSVVVHMTYQDNPWFGDTELQADMEYSRKNNYDEYLNIWGGLCKKVLEGSVYARELRRARDEGRIGKVPYYSEVPVSTFWDLGRANKTAIWFAQRVALQYRIISYYEANESEISMDDPSGGINHFIRVCQSKGYTYDCMFLPHDARAKRLGTKRSIQEMIGQFYPTRIVPNLSKTDGINAARVIFGNCWFDEEECADGLHSLYHYRYKIEDGKYSNDPVHDDASDGADAFRYLAVGFRQPKEKTKVGEKLAELAAAAIMKRQDVIGDSSRPISRSGRLGWLGR